MFRVPIAHLSDGLHTETLSPSADEVGLDPSVFSDVTVELRLDVRDRRVLAAFDVRATATLECDRTLEMYPQPLEGRHAVLFVPPGSASLDGDGDEDVLPLPSDATELDLTAPVHDTLLLAVPLRRVSPAGEALELETQYGADDTEAERDTRWDALRALGSDSPPRPAGDSSTD